MRFSKVYHLAQPACVYVPGEFSDISDIFFDIDIISMSGPPGTD